MYNNLPQQAPAYYYVPQTYSRAQMENQMPTPASLYSAPIHQPNYIKGRPVVSIDEARASQIDLDGSLFVFPDLGNKKIYTKQINIDGTATFNVFELAGSAAPEDAPKTEYVTKTELDAILTSFKESLGQTKNSKPTPAPSSFNL